MELEIWESINKAIPNAQRAFIENPDEWTRGAWARRQGGKPTSPWSDDAEQWCAVGRVASFIPMNVIDRHGEDFVLDKIQDELNHYEGSVSDWNDAPGRTVGDIIEMYGRAR